MATILSQSDVDRLLTDSSTSSRIALAGKIALHMEGAALTDAELAAAQDIIRIMARDIEVAVRAALADSLRHSSRLPHDVAVAMASDVDAVALPILGNSLVLTNDDLVQIVGHCSAARQTVIAARPDIAKPLASALVTHGDETAVSILMQNPGASISEDSLNRAIDRFPASDLVKESIAHRALLPITITERLVGMVSERLQDYLVSHHKLPPALATDMALRSRERATLQLSNGIDVESVDALVAQMNASFRLSPTLLLRALCIGDMLFFEAAMAALADVPVANARRLIHDGGDVGFAALYKKSALPAGLFAAFRAATDVVDGTRYDGEAHDTERFRARVITRLLTLVDDLPADDVDYLVERLGDVLTVA